MILFHPFLAHPDMNVRSMHRRHVGCIVSTTERECRWAKSDPPTRAASASKLAIVTLTLLCMEKRVCSCRTKQKKGSCSTLNLDSSSRDAYCPCLKIGRPQDQPLTFPATHHAASSSSDPRQRFGRSQVTQFC